jgi:hypothetical protein
MVSTLESIALIDSQAIISEFLISEILLSDKPDVLKKQILCMKT